MTRTRIVNGVRVDFTPEEEIERDAEEQAAAEEQVELAKTQYQRDRKAEYPSLEAVTVAMAEKLEGNSAMWDEITKQRQAIKDKYPKG